MLNQLLFLICILFYQIIFSQDKNPYDYTKETYKQKIISINEPKLLQNIFSAYILHEIIEYGSDKNKTRKKISDILKDFYDLIRWGGTSEDFNNFYQGVYDFLDKNKKKLIPSDQEKLGIIILAAHIKSDPHKEEYVKQVLHSNLGIKPIKSSETYEDYLSASILPHMYYMFALPNEITDYLMMQAQKFNKTEQVKFKSDIMHIIEDFNLSPYPSVLDKLNKLGTASSIPTVNPPTSIPEKTYSFEISEIIDHIHQLVKELKILLSKI